MRLSAHTRKGFDALWDLLEARVDGESSFDSRSVRALRDAFEELRAAQLQVFEAAIEAHRRLIAIATLGAHSWIPASGTTDCAGACSVERYGRDAAARTDRATSCLPAGVVSL